MNKISVKLALVLLICALMITIVGCDSLLGGNKTPAETSGTTENNGSPIDKTALNAEIALEVTEQNDYTADSYSAYSAALAQAKKVAGDAVATQENIDKATADLTAARLALVLKPIEEVAGANKTFNLAFGDVLEITLADYVNTNGLGKISYKVKASNAVVAVSTIADGKFTITAGEVREATDVTVSITVCYDGVEKLKVDLAVRISNEVAPTLVSDSVIKEYDMVDLGNKESILIDFAENVNVTGDLVLVYSVKRDGEEVVLDGTTYTLVLGNYTEEYTYTIFEVTATCEVNGEAKTLAYTYKLGLKDTCEYSIANGNFENGLDGWTFTNTEGDAPFGGIDNKTHYWQTAQNFPMNNVGSYFSAYADGASEASQGILASPYFVARGEYATYMLGGAGNPNVYITVEDKDGNVLALYRNTKFADIPEGLENFDAQREQLGVTIFLANFVTYKVSIAQWAGQQIRFVVHDHASEGWGVVFFDELRTYYGSSDILPEGAVLAENLLANRDALNAELALEVTEQGDYTAESYNAYLEILDAVKALVGDAAITQESLDEAVAQLTAARLALAIRPVEEVEGADKSFRLTSGNSKEIAVADYINVNGLSSITYAVKADNAAVVLGSVVDGKFTVTAGDVSAATDAKVSIIVSYNGEEKLVVELTVSITNDLTPTLKSDVVVREYDVYLLETKVNIMLDLSENVDNAGNLELFYDVQYGEMKEALNGSEYVFAFGQYTDTYTYEIITVTVSYVVNGEEQSVSYTYKLGLKDTTGYRIFNGGFEGGLEGWTVVGNIGNVSSDKNYWVNDPESADGYEFGMDGENMFSAYAPGAFETSVGTLTSPTFLVGGCGFVTFKVGAMRDENYVYVDVVDANTKEILARYYNGLWAERTEEVKSGCTLIAYKADLSAFRGREVFFRISDNADSGYGLFFADSFVTYYETEPEGFNPATPVSYAISGTIYDVFNGGFEMGDVQGWWNDGEIGVVTNANGYWGENIPYGKDGEYLFTGVESFGADTMREWNRGVLTSSVFEIGGSGYITFMLGGGGNALCYVQVIDAVTGEILARYHQQEMQDAVLKLYVADLSSYVGVTARIQVVDQAIDAWGCVSFDNVVTYYPEGFVLPEGAIVANDIKYNLVYDIENGSFETGNIDSWTMDITEEGTQGTLGWVLDTEIDRDWYAKNDETKDGDFLFTFVQPDDTNCENTKGTLTSSTFSLRQGSYVSFKFGGAGSGSNHDVYIELCRIDGSVIARFYNDAEGKVNTRMNSYYYQYNGVEVECFFRVVDNSTGNYGCFVVDDFRVNLESAPEGYLAAIQ